MTGTQGRAAEKVGEPSHHRSPNTQHQLKHLCKVLQRQAFFSEYRPDDLVGSPFAPQDMRDEQRRGQVRKNITHSQQPHDFIVTAVGCMRRLRRLRSWCRHEQQSIAATLVAATHHSALRGPKLARATGFYALLGEKSVSVPQIQEQLMEDCVVIPAVQEQLITKFQVLRS